MEKADTRFETKKGFTTKKPPFNTKNSKSDPKKGDVEKIHCVYQKLNTKKKSSKSNV